MSSLGSIYAFALHGVQNAAALAQCVRDVNFNMSCTTSGFSKTIMLSMTPRRNPSKERVHDPELKHLLDLSGVAREPAELLIRQPQLRP